MAAQDGRRAGEDIACTGNTFVVCVRLAGARVAEAWGSTGKMIANPDAVLEGTVEQDGSPVFARGPAACATTATPWPRCGPSSTWRA